MLDMSNPRRVVPVWRESRQVEERNDVMLAPEHAAAMAPHRAREQAQNGSEASLLSNHVFTAAASDSAPTLSDSLSTESLTPCTTSASRIITRCDDSSAARAASSGWYVPLAARLAFTTDPNGAMQARRESSCSRDCSCTGVLEPAGRAAASCTPDRAAAASETAAPLTSDETRPRRAAA